MSIVILKWNPGFSSYTMARFLNDLEKCALANNGNVDMNWSIWDSEKVHEGDTCFLLKVGYGQTGIVAKGRITSEPYSGEDWSWQNRPTKYCDFDFEIMVNPDAYPILTSLELSRIIPDIDWKGGHSGVVVTDANAEELERTWSIYMQKQAQYSEKASDQNLFILSKPSTSVNKPYTMCLEENYSGKEVKLKSNDEEGYSTIRILNYYRVLGKFGVKSWRTLQQHFYRQYPRKESLQELCRDLFMNKIEFHADFYQRECEENDAN